MKLFNWIQFQWNLAAFTRGETALPEHYQIAPATSDDEAGLRKVFSSAFILDPSWNPAIAQTMHTLQPWLDQLFAPEAKICLALRHGARIIGAAIVSLDAAADNHLVPGPCVLMEYRNRGFGTALLRSSLQLLADSGLNKALGITRPNAPVAKFLYPKFGGVAAEIDSVPLLAA